MKRIHLFAGLLVVFFLSASPAFAGRHAGRGNGNAASARSTFNRGGGVVTTRHATVARNGNRSRNFNTARNVGVARHWNGQRHHHHHHNHIVFIGGYGYPFYGYPYYSYYPYGYRYYGTNQVVYETNSNGAGGSVVVQVQQQLARDGYYRGAIDGVMGSRTHYAIRAYERSHGLSVDGEIDDELLGTMRLR